MSVRDEYASAVEIDPNRLDEEWLNQPKRFLEFAMMLADAKLTHAERKANVDVVRADVGKLIRAAPSNYGVIKATNDAVEAAVTTHSDVEKAVGKMNRAKHRMDMLQAVVDALDQRKKALENLVFLHGQEYFSEPREPKGEVGRKFREEDKKRTRKKVRINR